MDVSVCSELLLKSTSFLYQTEPEDQEDLRIGSNSQYLDTLARLALRPSLTKIVFATHEPLAVEICSRWLPKPQTDDLSALAALARILPSAPHLSVYARFLLDRREERLHGALKHVASQNVTALRDLDLAILRKVLISLYRLLQFDNETFASAVSPAQVQVLLHHPDGHVRYLAVRILSLYLHASDAALDSMIGAYIGERDIPGEWENRKIDYRYLSLWERKSYKDYEQYLQKCRVARSKKDLKEYHARQRRSIQVEDFSVTVACIGGVLIPRLGGKDEVIPSISLTETTNSNLHFLAEGIKSSNPVLVTGPSGAGKTSLIRHIARELKHGLSMATLHLNDQTDAKLLIGMYTSAAAPGSFSWQPGVLTTAVKEGRWVVIEDLDRAPTELISTLLPLLERQELLVPHWGESIKAAPGFKLIATMRSTIDAQGREIAPAMAMIGLRHWQRVSLAIPSDAELAEIIRDKYERLRAYLPGFIRVYQALKNPESRNLSRSVGPQDLLKWCRRVQHLLIREGVIMSEEAIPEYLHDQIFLEAVDCFAGAYQPGAYKTDCIRLIAENLSMPAERARYCLEARKSVFSNKDSSFSVGRSTLLKSKRPSEYKSSSLLPPSPFATTDHVAKLLESVAVAVEHAEPCLLVGETGSGKTTIVQHLAGAVKQKLTVVNLSQQSEVGDLLGGHKPLNMRTLAVPMFEEFEELLGLTMNFTSTNNHPFIERLSKQISKGRWTKALLLWQEALRKIDILFEPSGMDAEVGTDGPRIKKRRMQGPKVLKLKSRWAKFAANVKVFQNHLASGSKGFAFSFVESNIVKAARNGEWVLLDEINLASPDTLQSLADLLSSRIDGGPSICLTESGGTERIEAHENFRIFGAMNPATDVGKRNLPISIRSRFTEFFIEAPDKDFRNLVAVVEAYLGHYGNVDVQAANVARLYLDIQQLNNSNCLVDGANQKPHFSLRTLTRTLVYALDIAPMYGLRRAIFEGFSMNFLTTLNYQSEQLLRQKIEEVLVYGRKNSKALLHQIPRLPQDGKGYVRFHHYWIAQGLLPIESQPHYIITPFIERNLLSLVRATSTRRFPVLLQGPTSSGKTSMIEYLARISGNKFVRINNHEHTDLQEYFGAYMSDSNGRLQFQEGILVRALREGYWVILDELNLAPTDVLEASNRLLDDNRELFIPETQQVVTPHANFMLFATQNPPGMYGGRKVLSRAFRNRFVELHFDDIPENELEVILRERSQIAPSFCTRIVAVYKRLSILRQNGRLFEQKDSFATLRDLFRWALRDADDRKQLAINGFLLLGERVRNQEEREAVKSVIEDIMKEKIDEREIYEAGRIKGALPYQHDLSNGLVWTRSMRRLSVLVTEALKNNEPVLLVGETGSGKTTVCQRIADMMGRHLHVVNAHQNMETADLVGAQRPLRNKAHATAQLGHELTAALRDCNTYEEGHEYHLSELTSMYDDLERQIPETFTKQRRQIIEKARIKANSLFEWADSSLVTAMRDGDYFLLDEISLADDSVLERLNSVLEPGRTLFLAEKGASDDPLKANPGFQFLATMNPGGDYGKRELSPALRNRFTEIWVPNVSAEEELLEIVSARLLPQFSTFSRPMVAFAVWYSATFNIATPCISIRDLLSWIHFLHDFNHVDSYVRLLHGATMVYVDRLGANPASKSPLSDTSVLQEHHACITKLGELLGCDLHPLHKETYHLSCDAETLSIGPFSLPKAAGFRRDPNYSLHAPTTQANVLKLMRALQIRKSILIEGSPGVGKTTLVVALAKEIGMPLTRINLSDQTDLMDLFGSDIPLEGEGAGRFGWRDAPFLQAMQKGEWVLLDEMNLASQSVLEGLNACLDHRGQVYISELDHVFKRHPNFVVFAAQNPHHQGGGRKGLPASFVDRFSTVYADNFVQEDFMLIAKELSPNVSDANRSIVVQSVTTLSDSLIQNRRLGVRGGPWEINLRDVLRWLHLLGASYGMMPCASPAHYQNILFLQRFRTPEDVASVATILQHSIPQKHPRSYPHGKCAGLLECGLCLLPRNSRLKPTLSNAFRFTTKVNLEIVESVMLCIHNSWPCLLVGASGSGKSTIIFQLASSVGADVLEIPLNAEMDTSDIIGGYEQVDHQREQVGFLHRLREHTRTSMIRELQRGEEMSEALTELDALLQDRETEMAEVMELVRAIVEGSWRSTFTDYLEEGENLLQMVMTDNRARFEWVDGILVKALQQGKWVILDNANLCSPSVLDRLNSLLEPDGFLSMNEHRNADGSAQVMHPHKDFRLFLTMDPRHGELSRAMRNRSIELFMPVQLSSPSAQLLDASIESSVSRINLFQAFDWTKFSDSRFRSILLILFDHLTPSDLQSSHQWKFQIEKGLLGLLPSQMSIFSQVFQLYNSIFDYRGVTLCSIIDTYEMVDEHMVLSAPGFATMQTVHPSNNPYLLSLTADNLPATNLRWLSRRFEVLLKINIQLRALMHIIPQQGSGEISEWTSLQESMMDLRTGSSNDSAIPPLASFLQNMVEYLRRSLENNDFAEDESQEGTLRFFDDVVNYLQDVFDLAHSPEFDIAQFQVYHAIGRSLSTYASSDGMRNHSAGHLARELSSRLDTFNVSWHLSSGLGMEKLWSLLRPNTASSISQHNFSRHIKALADQFDLIKFSSGASIYEIEVLQRSMVQVYDAAQGHHSPNPESLTSIQQTLGVLHSKPGLEMNFVPYFQKQFKILYQTVRGNESDTSKFPPLLSLLTGVPTQQLMAFEPHSEGWEVLSRVQLLVAANDPTLILAPARGIFTISTLKKLQNINEVPLHSLDLLRVETYTMATISTTISAQLSERPLNTLYRALRKLHEVVRESLGLSDDALIRPNIVQLLQRFGDRADVESLPKDRLEYLRLCVDSVFDSQLFRVDAPDGGQPSDYVAAGSKCIQFFVGCLLFFVPDRPVDPALRPIIEKDRHEKRKKASEDKLNALRDFEAVYSGRTSSLRIVEADSDLKKIGNGPEVPLVIRPQTSQLKQLQNEYNNILSSIVIQSSAFQTQQSIYQNRRSQTVELLRANLTQAIERLSCKYDMYEDVTKPMNALLHGLDAGLALTLFDEVQNADTYAAIRSVCRTSPFLAADPASLASMDLGSCQDRIPGQPRLHQLRLIALMRSVDQDLDAQSRHVMFEAFHYIYENWTEKLSEGQREHAAQSSLYRFRGNLDDTDEADAEDFDQLFPAGISSTERERKGEVDQPDPRQQAQQLAQLHREIVKPNQKIGKSTSARILNLLQCTSQDIASIWQDQSGTSMSPIAAGGLLPALILGLEGQKTRLHTPSKGNKLYNFYLDANLVQASRAVQLVRAVQVRFTELQEVWPEHATLRDVLKTSHELLALRHTEPVAKLLTKAEQLYGYVHEWQVVASREYTAISLFNALTELLVDWRRLELSTWAELLNMEDQKCCEDADAWWFIAYKAIIAAPLALINEGRDVDTHAEHLFTTVHEFLMSTSMGQYSHRLRMIEDFISYLEILEQDFPGVRTVRNAVSNCLSYLRRFEDLIKNALLNDRRNLEKEMKDLILLASWKDTNINALRDSAKRSHHKLFKVVRKYRCILAKPSDTVIGNGFRDQVQHSKSEASVPVSPVKLTIPDERAFGMCQLELATWQSKPERYKNPVSTAHRMVSLSQLPSTAVDVASHLQSLGEDLKASMKALQAETPTETTKQNGGFIKHLKGRKQKLYADTLKALRRMGFRSNISADTLVRQKSLAAVLTHSPAPFKGSKRGDLDLAEYHYHVFLHEMPQVRTQAQSPSENLNRSDVTKSLGYLESMMTLIIKQRVVLANAMDELALFESTLLKVDNLWYQAGDTIKVKSIEEAATMKRVNYVLKWLPAIIEAGSTIIEKYGNLGGKDCSYVLESLQTWKERLTAKLLSLSALLELPVNLSSSQHEQAIHEGQQLLHEFKEQLHVQINNHPSLEFVLKHFEVWSDTDLVCVEQQEDNRSICELKTFDEYMSSLMDSILVTVQEMQKASSSLPTSYDDRGWLLRSEESLTCGLKSLQAVNVNNKLDTILSRIQQLSGQDINVAAALCTVSMPILKQYFNIYNVAVARYAQLHRSLCEFASFSVGAFSKIALDGFCGPAERSNEEYGKMEKLEGGTGLGEGEGAEDISKDIQDDEDISELAQTKDREKEEEERKSGVTESLKDAVDMDHDEMEANMTEASDKDENNESASEDENQDIEEETGTVDDIDPSMVDEKLWDGKNEDTKKEKEGVKRTGQSKQDEQIAAEAVTQHEDTISEQNQSEDRMGVEGEQENEEIANEQAEKVDPHAEEGQNLELPEEMDLKDMNDGDAEIDVDDGDIDDMSDMEQEQEEVDETMADPPNIDGDDRASEDKAKPSQGPPELLEEIDEKVDESEVKNSPVDTEASEDELRDPILRSGFDDADVDPADAAPSDVRGLGEELDPDQDGEQAPSDRSQASRGKKANAMDSQDAEAVAEDGQPHQNEAQPKANQTQDTLEAEGTSSQAFKKLGNALEQWHRQNKEIRDAVDQDESARQETADADMTDQDFEHLENEEQKGETQALGAAAQDQARALNDQAMESEVPNGTRDFPSQEITQDGEPDTDEVMEDKDAVVDDSKSRNEQSHPSTLVADNAAIRKMRISSNIADIGREEDIEDHDMDLPDAQFESTDIVSTLSLEEARSLWIHHEGHTRELSIALTEQLRLILAPTQATKMRGDFRTGKRLNIKRIIPYIASQYKRDKIWMRRSIPSKRNYQIMLAVDDSKSMGESGSGKLAFETLALVAKSLSMLEVGEICIVGFGNEVHVAHAFEKPFSSEAGAEILQRFSFQQDKTNVRKLVADSITLFREAKRKTLHAGADTWQLELIISDGICEDHDTIRRLVRQAQEERIMIVFVIVDALLKGESIVDMSEAVFEPDESGETKLKIKRYLEGFPFPYYVVVGDVKDLPGVLAQALRQWFAEVAESE